MNRLLRRAAALFLLVLPAFALGGCATAPPPGSADAVRGNTEGLLVEVLNDNRGDFEIFLVRDGSASRLGVVTSGSSARFQVPRVRFSGQGQVALRARSLVGSAQYSSPTVLVNVGERLVLTLSPEIRFSNLNVRR
jgi:hypothetical protein